MYDTATLVITYHVDAADVRIDAARQIHALHLRAVLRVAQDLFCRNAPGAQDALLVINVGNEGVERADPLPEALLESGPFGARQDARDDVERDQPFGAFVLAVDRKGDAHTVEQRVGFGALAGEVLGRLLAQPAVVLPAVAARRTRAIEHLIVGTLAGNHQGY
jgi:hypothetical protein